MALSSQELDLARRVKQQGGTQADFLEILENKRKQQKDAPQVEAPVLWPEEAVTPSPLAPTPVWELIRTAGKKLEAWKEDLPGFDLWVKASQWIQKLGQSLQPFSKKEEAPFLWLIERWEGLSASGKESILVATWQFAANLPWNIVEFGWDILNLISDPITPAIALKDVAEWIAMKAISTWLASWVEFGWDKKAAEDVRKDFAKNEKIQMVDAIWRELKKVATNPEELQKLIVTNPTDVLLTFTWIGNILKTSKVKTVADLWNKLSKITPVSALKAEGKLAVWAAKAPFKVTASTIRGVTPEKVSNAIAWIDIDTAKVLKNTSKPELDKVLTQAQESMEDIWNVPSPFAKAWTKAEEAMDILRIQKKTAWADKWDALKWISWKNVETVPIIDKFDDLLSDRFNLKVNNEWKLVWLNGKIPKSADELQAFADALLELRTTPGGKISLENLDALVDNLQAVFRKVKIDRQGAN